MQQVATLTCWTVCRDCDESRTAERASTAIRGQRSLNLKIAGITHALVYIRAKRHDGKRLIQLPTHTSASYWWRMFHVAYLRKDTMAADYEAVKEFIRETVLNNGRGINPLERTYPVVESITQQFSELGWSVTKITNTLDKVPLHRLSSPDGSISLSMRGGKVYRHTSAVETICKYKNFTRTMLQLGKVRIPQGANFPPDQLDVAIEYYKKMPKPVVVKPSDAAGSRGVTVGIQNLKSFTTAWDEAVNYSRPGSKIMVEEFIRGIELRAYVVGRSTVSVVARVQPFVMGDGESSLEELVADLKTRRTVNYRTRRQSLRVDWHFVQAQGFDQAGVPAPNEVVLLNKLTTARVGGLAIDVTQLVADELKELAVAAVKSITGLEVAGVDLLASDLSDASSAFVIEVNTSASPDLHRYPAYGIAHNVETYVVEHFHNEYLGTR